MILYGRNLSPFTRRVAIWCALQGRTVEQIGLAMTEPKDVEAITAVHPGTRVPALKLDDGTVLIDSFAICDWLEQTAPPGRRLVPAGGVPRRDCLNRLAMAHATAEKIVALVYEKNRRPEEFHWPAWQERLVGQIRGGFAAMEAAAPVEGFHGGAAPDGSDVAAICAYQMGQATNSWLLDPGYPKLAGLVARAMEIAAVAETNPAA
ncbi:MAG: glutathione S-transferase family protein [Pseudomonadota bacterium]